jgi:hypothetical protein
MKFTFDKIEESIRDVVKVGDVVSYKYATVSKNGVPVNTVIYRIRRDLIWSDVLKSKNVLAKKRSIDGKTLMYHHILIANPFAFRN